MATLYSNVPAPDYTGIYDQATENSVTALQRTAGLQATGRLDADTWNAMAHLYSHVGNRPDEP